MMTVSRIVTLSLLCVNVALVSSAQLLLKIGAGKVNSLFDRGHLFMSSLRIMFNPYIFFGTFCYVVSLVLWIYILTRSQLSISYPFMSLSYGVVMILSILFLNEVVNLPQWGGFLLIVAGTTVIFFFK